MLPLLHLCDSLFPIGGFAYSDGLEAATASGQIADGAGLRHWLDTCLDESFGRCDGVAVARAWTAFTTSDWTALATLDAEVIALRPSGAARRSSRAMGQRLLGVWQSLHPDARLAYALELVREGRLGPALPVAFAGAAATSSVDCRTTAEAFAYTRLAATVSAAMRLMAIGQHEAHELLARTLERVPRVVDRAMAAIDVESFAPAMDVASMSQQYLHSRLFRS